MKTLVDELLRKGKYHLLPSEDILERDELVDLDPQDPQKIAIMASGRDYMAAVGPQTRNAAIAHASDVFEPGTVHHSLLLKLLET